MLWAYTHRPGGSGRSKHKCIVPASLIFHVNHCLNAISSPCTLQTKQAPVTTTNSRADIQQAVLGTVHQLTGNEGQQWQRLRQLLLRSSSLQNIMFYLKSYTGTDIPLWKYEVENSYIITKTCRLHFDVSISSRDLHQKKLVLSSSESWIDHQLVIQTRCIYFSVWKYFGIEEWIFGLQYVYLSRYCASEKHTMSC